MLAEVPNPMLIARENIPMVFENLKEDIENVIEDHSRGELDLQIIEQSLHTGTQQLWLYTEQEQGHLKIGAWAITSISDYGFVKRLRFVLMGGEDIDKWLLHIDAIEQWAARIGATEAEGWVRPGLRKKLCEFGYSKAYEVVTKELVNRTLS